MKEISPLISGINGCANGTVSIKRRGTGTYATYYTAFEAPTGSAVTPTADVALDSNGRLVAFVNELVDVTCKDSSGNTVVTFTAGEAAPSVEAITRSFTGVDYITGASGASKPTTMQVILDAWFASAGALDFNVLQGGASRTLQAALASLTGLFYNVKDAIYGAVGDGVVDDSAAIQAALTAAGATTYGGLVFFPSGLYRTTVALNVPANVSLMGVGSFHSVGGGNGGSTITIDHASNSALSYAAASNAIQTITGIGIKAKQANSGRLISIINSVQLKLDSCFIGASTSSGGCIRANTAGTPRIEAYNCTFEVGGTTGHLLTTLGHMSCYGCAFIHPTGTFAGGISWDSVGGGVAVGCTFINNTITAGGFTNIRFQTPGTTVPNLISGCVFQNPTGGTCTAWDDSTAQDSLHEVCNVYGSSVDFVPKAATGAQASRFGSNYLSRLNRASYVQNDTTPITIVPERNAVVRVQRNTNTNQTLNITAANTPGERFTLVYDNSSGGNIAALTFTGASALAGGGGILAGLVQIYDFVAVEYNSKIMWAITSSLPGAFAR